MNSFFGIFMESWILRIACKVSEGLHVNFARYSKYSWFHIHSKNDFIAYIYIIFY